MAYIALLWKARTIEKCRLKYEKEKLNSIRLNSNTQSQERWWKVKHETKERCTNLLGKIYPEGSPVYNCFYYMKTDLTFPNFVLKSVIGFVGGIILTYLCFLFFVFQLSISLIHATCMSSIIGVLLTLGLAFSYRIRCLVFLLIPQFFSRVGRYTITCYALVLILTGPATNTLKNSEVLSESMACGQEQIKTTVNQINKFEEQPLDSINDSLHRLVDKFMELNSKIKVILLRVQRLVLALAHSLQSGNSWLESIRKTCDRRVGNPYTICTNAIRFSVPECEANFGPRFSWLCNLSYVTDKACTPVKRSNNFCLPLDFVDSNILVAVKDRLDSFSRRVNSLLNLEVNFHHSYTFSSNASKSASQVAAGIVTEIRNRADPLLTWLSWSSCVTSLFLLLIIFRAKEYQHMYETRSRFDNLYISKQLRAIDLKRQKQGRETVLPLNRREKAKYIETTSFRLVSSEKFNLGRSVVFMALTTFKLMIHMVADYSLYWVLMTIRYHGRFQSPINPGNPQASLPIKSIGLVSKIYKAILNALSMPLMSAPASPVTCLPDPSPPDLQRYSQIGILIVMLWFFSLFEPYGLRLRHLIMGLYRPERAKARAVWLYNHIQRTRGGFLKFARRKLHREYKYHTEEKHTFQRWLDRQLPWWWLRVLLGTAPKRPRCLLCGTAELRKDPDTKLFRCRTPRCPGVYCRHCFSDIGELCTICLSPSDYGDLSDVSIERGSTDEDSDYDGSDAEGNVKRQQIHEQSQSTNREQSRHDKQSKNKWWAWSLQQNDRFTHDYEELSSFDSLKYGESDDYVVHNDFLRIRSKALKVRRKVYDNDIVLKENRIKEKCVRECNDNTVWTLKPANMDASKTIDDKTKKFSTVSKRIQRDRQQCNYEGRIENDMKNETKRRNLLTLLTRFKGRLKNFKAHRYKIWSYNDNNSKLSKFRKCISALRYCFFFRKKRRKKKSMNEFFVENIKVTEPPEINIERKINLINICQAEAVPDKNALEDFCDKECFSNEAVKNWSEVDDRNRFKDTLLNPSIETDISHNVIHFALSNTENENEKKKVVDINKIWHKSCWPKSSFSFNTQLCYFFQSIFNHFGYRNSSHSNERDLSKRSSDSAHKTGSQLQEMDTTRKYRLSSYLAGHDWMVRHIDYKRYLRCGLQKLLSISEYTVSNPVSENQNNSMHTVAIQKDTINDKILEIMGPVRKIDQQVCSHITSSVSVEMSRSMSRSLNYFKSLGLFDYTDDGLPKICTESKELVLNLKNRLRQQRIKKTQTVNRNVQPTGALTERESKVHRKNNFTDLVKDLIAKEENSSEVEIVRHNYNQSENESPIRKDQGVNITIEDKNVQSQNVKTVMKKRVHLRCSPKGSMSNKIVLPDQEKIQYIYDGIGKILNVMTTCLCNEKAQCVCKHGINEIIANLVTVYPNKVDNNDFSVQYEEPKIKQRSAGTSMDNLRVRTSLKDVQVLATPEISNAWCDNPSENFLKPSCRSVGVIINKDRKSAKKICSCGTKSCNKTRNVGIWHSGRRYMYSKGLGVDIKTPTRTIATMFGKGFGRTKPRPHRVRDYSTESVYTSYKDSYKPPYKPELEMETVRPKYTKFRDPHQTRKYNHSVFNDSLTSSFTSNIMRYSEGGMRTDTTVYTVATFAYGERVDRKKRRFRIVAVTKTNRGTHTDNTNLINHGTMTSQVWNPIVDRRDKCISLVKDRAQNVQRRLKRKVLKSQSVATDTRVVTFKSSTQIIPREPDDNVLSPSRYLLESQKYYNELFYDAATAGMRHVSRPYQNREVIVLNKEIENEYPELDGMPSMHCVVVERKVRRRHTRCNHDNVPQNKGVMVQSSWDADPMIGDYLPLKRRHQRPRKKRSGIAIRNQGKPNNYWSTDASVYWKKLDQKLSTRDCLSDDN